ARFDHFYFRSRGEPAASMLGLAQQLPAAVDLVDEELEKSIRIHLGSLPLELHPLRGLLAHKDTVHAVAFSPDGKTVLTGSADKTARLWEAATGKPLGQPLQHQDFIMAVAVSPNGKTLLTGSADRTAQLWEAATGKPIGQPLQHQMEVMAVAFGAN